MALKWLAVTSSTLLDSGDVSQRVCWLTFFRTNSDLIFSRLHEKSSTLLYRRCTEEPNDVVRYLHWGVCECTSFDFRWVNVIQILHIAANYVPYPRCHSHRHPSYLYHLLATPDSCHLLPIYPNWQCTLRLLQAGRGIPQAGKGRKRYRCESAVNLHRLRTHFTSSIITEMDRYGMLSSLFYMLISLV